MEITRRGFVTVMLAAGASTALGSRWSDDTIEWHTISPTDLNGRGWAVTKPDFGRLPAWAEGKTTAGVWNNGTNAAGQYLDFVTDSPELRVSWAVGSGQLAMWHMTAAGKSGLDLYARDADGSLRWYAVAGPGGQRTENKLIARPPDPLTHYRLYLPLYNELTELSVGVQQGSSWQVTQHDSTKRKPMVFYGTSIMHGCSASRPGMAFTSVLGRRFGLESINLGFSGSARMEPVVADLLAEIDASIYAVDALPNMNTQLVRERTVPFIERLREKRPQTPILLVEGRQWTNAWANPGRLNGWRESSAALQEAFNTLQAKGVNDLHYLGSQDQLGDDSEATIDGSHPTDLGMMRYADAYEPILRKMLAE